MMTDISIRNLRVAALNCIDRCLNNRRLCREFDDIDDELQDEVLQEMAEIIYEQIHGLPGSESGEENES